MKTDLKDEYYSIQEVADKLKVAYLTVYRWIQSSRIEAFKVGKQYRITSQQLSNFLKNSRV